MHSPVGFNKRFDQRENSKSKSMVGEVPSEGLAWDADLRRHPCGCDA